MQTKKVYAEMMVSGLVQGVGFRYFVFRNATRKGLKGYVKNLPSGQVLTAVEGEKKLIEELAEQVKSGPSSAHVSKFTITWDDFKNTFSSFEIRH